ncbi:hypothetical protein TrLO_g13665 [Triparma laevis f. longispina]|uniref:Exocyst complex component Sec3 C-terminal domain-containing protein n=1 Tax=Triparma laevis f. longispina TaxID=1714387 RepID=A0A9W7A1K6_9STRA|nr:hypothetical protein TrLO_g13665 [Triparma laevis f. longispina]
MSTPARRRKSSIVSFLASGTTSYDERTRPFCKASHSAAFLRLAYLYSAAEAVLLRARSTAHARLPPPGTACPSRRRTSWQRDETETKCYEEADALASGYAFGAGKLCSAPTTQTRSRVTGRRHPSTLNSDNANLSSTATSNSTTSPSTSLSIKTSVSNLITQMFTPPDRDDSEEDPSNVAQVLFSSKVRKPDHAYSQGNEDVSLITNVASYWSQGKDRFFIVVNVPPTFDPQALQDLLPASSNPSSSNPSTPQRLRNRTKSSPNQSPTPYMLYVVVLPKPLPSSPLKVEIRQSSLLTSLKRISCPGGSINTSTRTGGNLELKFEDLPPLEFSATPQMLAGDNDNGFDSREAVAWNLVQLNRILCPNTLSVDGIDIEELEFLSEVHGFLADNEVLTTLLEEEEENLTNEGGEGNGTTSPGKSPGKNKANANLFSNREEELDAEKVLNSLPWSETDAAGLNKLLREKLAKLESECCNQLISWEEDSIATRDSVAGRKLALSSLITTLSDLDGELETMETWLLDRTAAVKPLTDDCALIEEENNALEQTWRSYASLTTEMDRLLNGLEIDEELQIILKDPLKSLLSSNANSTSRHINLDDIDDSAIEKIASAGTVLRAALDRAAEGGGVHLAAVNERVADLMRTEEMFCGALGDFVLRVLAEAGEDFASGLYVVDAGAYEETREHFAALLKALQRRYQSLILQFQPLVQTLTILKPQLVPALRKGYSESVKTGLYGGRGVSGYFKSAGTLTSSHSHVTDLKDYPSTTLRSLTQGSDTSVASTDKDFGARERGDKLEDALGDLLPIITREGFFVSALFGLETKSGESVSAAEASRNATSVSSCVENGIEMVEAELEKLVGCSETEGGGVVSNLLGSQKLEEAIARLEAGASGEGEKTAITFLGKLRSRAEKCWRSWLDEQIVWVNRSHGVPLNGKRAGVMQSFSKYPSFLYRILSTNSGVTPGSIATSLTSLADALFESLEMVTTRSSCDKQYATQVLTIENCAFFIATVSQRSELLFFFKPHLDTAKVMLTQATNSYISWSIKREFKGLYVLFNNIEKIRKDVGDQDVPIHCPRTTFVRTLTKEVGTGVIKGQIEEIRKRMEKHFAETSDLSEVWEEMSSMLLSDYEGYSKLASQLYRYRFEVTTEELRRVLRGTGGDVSAIMRRRSGGDKTGGKSPSQSN